MGGRGRGARHGGVRKGAGGQGQALPRRSTAGVEGDTEVRLAEGGLGGPAAQPARGWAGRKVFGGGGACDVTPGAWRLCM